MGEQSETIAEVAGAEHRQSRRKLRALAACVGAGAVCGIVYQLVIGTVSTYLVGNSTYQFSLTIGLFMFAYGLGSFGSTRIRGRLEEWFFYTEVALGFVGGIASFLLFYLYGTTELFGAGRVLLILLIGTLVGLEIPLLIRISEAHRRNLRVTVGEMIGFDYLGALVGGVGFPLVLLPFFGLLGASFVVGVCNVLVAVLFLAFFSREIRAFRLNLVGALCVAALLFWFGVRGDALERIAEEALYEDALVHFEQTPYQRLALTRRPNDLRLYLDGSLQFSSADEYRYHEALVHPAATRLARVRRVLVLGGGDGLALREIGRYPELESVTLVDLDPAVVKLGREHPALRKLNEAAFERLPVEVRHEDAFNFVGDCTASYDLVVIDLPDPHHESLAKLYSVGFYRSLKGCVAKGGLVAAQLGSPFFGNRTYWTSIETLRAAGWTVRPYHVHVPSFGEWGFALASASTTIPDAPARPIRGRFYEPEAERAMFYFPADLRARHEVEPNRLLRPVIVEHYRRDWKGWN